MLIRIIFKQLCLDMRARTFHVKTKLVHTFQTKRLSGRGVRVRCVSFPSPSDYSRDYRITEILGK